MENSIENLLNIFLAIDRGIENPWRMISAGSYDLVGKSNWTGFPGFSVYREKEILCIMYQLMKTTARRGNKVAKVYSQGARNIDETKIPRAN